MEKIENKIKKNIKEKLKVEFLSVSDDSDQHKGHSGWQPEGETHFSVTVVSDDFISLPRVKRHRVIYDTLSDLLKNKIHALALKTYTKEEWNNKSNI